MDLSMSDPLHYISQMKKVLQSVIGIHKDHENGNLLSNYVVH